MLGINNDTFKHENSPCDAIKFMWYISKSIKVIRQTTGIRNSKLWVCYVKNRDYTKRTQRKGCRRKQN